MNQAPAVRLISAPWVFPVTAPPIPDGAVIVNDDQAAGTAPAAGAHTTVIAVGTRTELRQTYPGATESRADGALLPALINAHAHLELSAWAGQVAGGDGIVNWTRRLATRQGGPSTTTTAGSAPPADGAILAAAVSAARAARAFGTGAIADVGNGTAGWRALAHAGLGGVFFHELVGSREARTGDALADAAAERAAVPRAERPPGVMAVPAPHAPYSVGPALLRRIFAAAAAAQQSTTIHLAEDDDEILLLRDGTGAWPAVFQTMGIDPEEQRRRTPRLSPTEYMEHLGAFTTDHPPLLVHMVHATAADRQRAQVAKATVVLCPRSNLHIGARLPDVPALIRDGVRLAIGTDSLASVSDLSPWQEIATLAARFPDVPPSTWLHAATRGGAGALGLTAMGALAPGRRPGLLDVGIESDGPAAPTDAAGVLRALVLNPRPTVHWIGSGPSGLPAPSSAPTQGHA